MTKTYRENKPKRACRTSKKNSGKKHDVQVAPGKLDDIKYYREREKTTIDDLNFDGLSVKDTRSISRNKQEMDARPRSGNPLKFHQDKSRFNLKSKKTRVQLKVPEHIPKRFVVEPINKPLSRRYYSLNNTRLECQLGNLELETQVNLNTLRNMIPDMLGINALTDSINNVVDMISDGDMDNPQIRPEIMNLIESIPITSAKMGDDMDALKSMFSQIADFGLVALGLICICIAAMSTNKIVKITLGVLALYCLWKHPLFKSVLLELVNVLKDKLETQSGLDSGFIATIFSVLWVHYTGKKDHSLPGIINDQLRAVPKIQPTILQITEWVLQSIEVLAQALCDYFNVPKDIEFWKDPNTLVQKFIDRSKDFIALWDGERLHRNVTSATLVNELISEGEKLLISFKGKYTPSTMLINRYLTNLNQIKVYFTDNKLSLDGLRQEPVCAVFRGAPGNFKTAAIQHLSAAVIAKVLQEFGSPAEIKAFNENPNSFTFNRQHENKYWEGYTSKALVVFMDDFGQARDQPGDPDNEYMNLIRMVNEFAMHCHMAELSKKDSVYFGSPFVLCSTNLAEFRPQSINSQGAINRRFDFDIVVKPKIEYANNPNAPVMSQTINKRLLPIGVKGISSNNPQDILDFVVMNGDGAEILTFDELVEEMFNKYRTKKLWFEQKVVELENTKERFLQREEEETIFDLEELQIEVQSGLTIQHDPWLLKVVEQLKRSKNSVLEWIDSFIVFCSIKNYDEFRVRFIDSYLSVCESVGIGYRRGIFKLEKMCVEYLPTMIKAVGTVVWHKMPSLSDTVKELVFKIPQGITDFFYDVYKFIVEKKWILLGAIGIISLILGSVKLYKEVPAIITSRRARKRHGDPVAQTVYDYDQNLLNIVNKVVERNCYEAHIVGNENSSDDVIRSYDKVIGYITFVKGQTAVMPYHFFREIDRNLGDRTKEFNLVLRSNIGPNFDHIIRVDEFLSLQKKEELIGSQDLTLVVFPFIRQHATIVEFFKDERSLKKIGSTPVVLVHPSYSNRVDNHTNAVRHTASFDDKGTKVTVSTAFWYTLNTTKGDCGSILIQADPTVQKAKLIGFHVAGGPSGGYGVTSALSIEQLNNALSSLEKKHVVDDSNFELETQATLPNEYNQFVGLGKVDKFPGGPTKNEHIRSRLHGCFCGEGEKPRKMPSLLHPKKINGELVDPMVNGLKNYGSRDIGTIDSKKLSAACASYWLFLRRNSPHKISPRILDHEEIVKGIEGEPLFKSVNRGSSLGYPYNATPRPGFKGKTYLLGFENEYDLNKPEFLQFMEEVKEIENNLFENKRGKFIFTDNLKDEKLKRAKVEIGKTRVFSASPFHLVYLVRKYFGSFSLWFAKNNIDNGCAVGLNPYSLDWNKLAAKMLSKGGTHKNKRYGAGDYKAFDGSEKARIHWAILDIIQLFYRQSAKSMNAEELAQLDKECQVRHILWLEVVNSIHLVRGVLMMWINSLPSGHPLTTIINNMYNHIAMRYCWITLHSNELRSVWSFDDHVYLCTMGDDQIFAVSEERADIFTEANISKAMGELGLTYTSDTKDGVNVNLREMCDITFLKRTFRWNTDLKRWVAPLDHDTIEEICYWTKPGINKDSIVVDHCDSMILEWSIHGREWFNEWTPKLLVHLSERYPLAEVRTDDYETALDLACNKEIEW